MDIHISYKMMSYKLKLLFIRVERGQMDIAESGSSQLLTLMIETPGDLV